MNKSNKEVKATVRERIMGTALLKRSDMLRYGPLMTNIRDQHGYGIDVYPKILASAHGMLKDYVRSRKLFPIKKKQKTNGGKLKDSGNDKEKIESDTGVMYSQDDVVPGTNGKVYAQVKCHECQKFGHYKSHCPEAEGVQNLNIDGEQEKEKENAASSEEI